jgi:hypothetical protein
MKQKTIATTARRRALLGQWRFIASLQGFAILEASTTPKEQFAGWADSIANTCRRIATLLTLSAVSTP